MDKLLSKTSLANPAGTSGLTKRINLFRSRADDEEKEAGSPNNSTRSTSLSQAHNQLEMRIAQLERENHLLKQERETQRQMLKELTKVVQAGKNAAKTEELEDDFLAGKVITADDALDLTVFNLRQQVESMEDERESFIRTIVNLEAEIHDLKLQNEAKDCKIDALQSVYTATKKAQQTTTQASSANPNFKPSLGFKARGASLREEREINVTL
jgi:cell division protein FtsB